MKAVLQPFRVAIVVTTAHLTCLEHTVTGGVQLRVPGGVTGRARQQLSSTGICGMTTVIYTDTSVKNPTAFVYAV